MKKLFISFLLSIIINISYSQIRVENTIHLPIFFSYGYYESADTDNKGFYTKGWWKILPNETITINVPFSFITHPTIYYTFNSDKGNFRTKEQTDGKNNFLLLVDPVNPFFIRNAHMNYVKDNNPNYEYRYFNTKNLTLSQAQQQTCNIIISYNDL